NFPSSDFIATLTKDLCVLIHSAGIPVGLYLWFVLIFKVIQSCVKCLCAVVQSVGGNQVSNVKNLFNTFYQKLGQKDIKDQRQLDQPTLMIVVRALFSLGNLCKYYDFDGGNPNILVIPDASDQLTECSVEELREKKYGVHVENLYKVYTEYWKHQDI